MNILKFSLIILAIAAIPLAGYYIFSFMAYLLAIWVAGYLIADKTGLVSNMSKREKQFYHAVIIIYPILETVIKYMLVNNVIAFSWNWLNRIEHFLSAVGIGTLLYPYLYKTLLKLNYLERFLFIVFTVTFIGNINEFVEYLKRLQLGLTSVGYFSVYYWDTIYDMAINTIGAIFFAIIMRLINKIPQEK